MIFALCRAGHHTASRSRISRDPRARRGIQGDVVIERERDTLGVDGLPRRNAGPRQGMRIEMRPLDHETDGPKPGLNGATRVPGAQVFVNVDATRMVFAVHERP